MSDQSEKLAQFTSITGASEDRAKFFLDSSAWQVEVALARYFENEGEGIEEIPQSTPEAEPEEPSTNIKKTKGRTRGSNVATLNSLNASSDDEEEEGQAYYAGGSEHSGQQVLGPSKKKDIVADMFKSVQEHGVEMLDPGASSSSTRAFKGTGYKLGQDNSETVTVAGEVDPPEPTRVTLRLWQNGFSINNEDLRPYTDPSNREFLESIRRGEIPVELREGNNEVHLAMEDHRMEQFIKPERKGVKAFQGQGYALGSPAPVVVGAAREEDKPANEEKAKQMIKVDSEKPVTSLQIRLADGSRLVGQFNHEHTVAEIRTYIVTARPQYQTQPFNLMSTYPSKVLNDSDTLSQAGLLNAAIMQKLI